MHRTELLALLADYRQRHPEEAVVVDTFDSFVRANEACFERSLAVGHVTGSAWLVSENGQSVLLTHHRKLNRWLQLGGHADGDPDITAVALREAQEESGLSDITAVTPAVFDLDIHVIPARGPEPEHLHYDVRFAFVATGDQSFVVSDESNDLAWVSIDTIDEYVGDASLLRMASKWVKR